jgi:hypothetical protein
LEKKLTSRTLKTSKEDDVIIEQVQRYYGVLDFSEMTRKLYSERHAEITASMTVPHKKWETDKKE